MRTFTGEQVQEIRFSIRYALSVISSMNREYAELAERLREPIGLEHRLAVEIENTMRNQLETYLKDGSKTEVEG